MRQSEFWSFYCENLQVDNQPPTGSRRSAGFWNLSRLHEWTGKCQQSLQMKANLDQNSNNIFVAIDKPSPKLDSSNFSHTLPTGFMKTCLVIHAKLIFKVTPLSGSVPGTLPGMVIHQPVCDWALSCEIKPKSRFLSIPTSSGFFLGMLNSSPRFNQTLSWT